MTHDRSLSNPRLDLMRTRLSFRMRFRLRDRSSSEDRARKKLWLAASRKVHTVSWGQASEKTWLVGILRHEDTRPVREVRQARASLRPRRISMTLTFKKWPLAARFSPVACGRPGRTNRAKRVLDVFTHGCRFLSARTGNGRFILRERNCLDTDEICEVLNVSTHENLG